MHDTLIVADSRAMRHFLPRLLAMALLEDPSRRPFALAGGDGARWCFLRVAA